MNTNFCEKCSPSKNSKPQTYLLKDIMKKIKALVLFLTVVTLISCTSLDEKVKEYRGISEEIATIYDEISSGIKSKDVGVTQITELKLKLDSFDPEVSNQYMKEEEIKLEIERESIRLQEKSRLDSIQKAKTAHEEALKAKEEVAEMIRLEEEADRIAYMEELKEKGVFLVEFDGETYEINQKDWDDWKISQNYNSAEDLKKTEQMVRAMGHQKAQGLANSMYRTLSNGIAREGITFKAIQGIQVYNVITQGNSQFD